MPAAAPTSGSTRSRLRPGAAPAPQGNPRGGPPAKKDNTPMIVGGVAVGLLCLVGLGFAMMGGKEPPKKKEAPKPVEQPAPPAAKPYDPWDDPSKQGSLTDAAKRRQSGLNDQNKSGEVDHKTDGK
jgi:hypothetical protein